LSRLKCQLNVFSRSPHISQILTGFIMLRNEKVINLEINYKPEMLKLYPTPHMIEAIIDNRIKVAYDMLDGYNFNKQVVEKYLMGIDFYFKRSYNIAHHKDFEYASRIYPLGFNYHVTTPKNIIDKRWDISSIYAAASSLRNNIFFYKRNFYIEKFEDIPHWDNETLILFLTRAWDPEESSMLDEKIKAERYHINNMRADCIIKLREIFGGKFIGGFSPSPYTHEKFPSCVVDRALTKRTNFMRLVKKANICVATMGLHESNGWKLGEYIAASKAIVAEKLHYDVPGNFNNIDNYFEFTNADQCVQQVMKLYSNKKLAFDMMIKNYNYYHNFLRADRLIFNTITIAIKDADCAQLP